MHLRSRLTGTLLLSVGLALVISALADLVFLRVLLRHDFAQGLRQESLVVMRYWRRHKDLPYRFPPADSVAVYTPQHALVMWFGSEAPPAPPREPGFDWSGSTLTVTRFLPGSGGAIMVYANAFVLVTRPLRRLAEILLAVTLGCFLLAWLASVRLTRDLTRPLTDLTEAATLVSASAELDTRVSESSPVVEVRSLAQAFNTMIDRLGSVFAELRRSEQRERALREAAAHDLYTPLSTVLASLELMENDALSEEDRRQALDMARREARRLRTRVDQALGRSNVERADVVAIARRIMGNRSKVHPPTARAQILVAADPGEVIEVLDLVVDNALRHNREGTEVWIECSTEADKATMTVRDNGGGIAEDLLPVVLEREVSGAPSTGLGLGLPLARDLVRSRGGELTVTSVKGEGTVVTVRWPLVAS